MDRANELTLKAMNYYDGIAKGYAELYHVEQIIKISKILNYLPENGKLLDLGSGDGVLNNFISKEVKLISLDLSFKLLKLNSNKNSRIVGSISNLPFLSNSFNFVVSFTVFQDLIEPLICIDEVIRILKKNGIFILSFLQCSKNSQAIIKYLEENFVIIEKIEEKKDFIYILKKI